jgi:hypothetical protein
MIKKFKDLIRNTFVYDIIRKNRQEKELKEWEKNGRPFPIPSMFKQGVIAEYAKIFSTTILIETGTFLGDMIAANKDNFDKIYSIELDKDLYKKCKKRFEKFKHIEISLGDSGEILPRILEKISSPCLFWLDAYYSGGGTARGNVDTPIVKELRCILKHKINGHVILIDDAYLFVGGRDYPTLSYIKKLVSKSNQKLVVEVKDDIIRIHKKILYN